MDYLFKGGYRILYIKVDAAYLPVACLTSNPIDEGVEMLTTTTAESNGWRTSIPTNQFYSISFEGLQIATGNLGNALKLSYDELKALKRARTQIEWKIQDTEGYFIDEGKGYITDLGESNEVGDILRFNGSIEGFGEPTFSRTLVGDLFQSGDDILFQNGNIMIFN
jgi:hypothetical protein